MKLSELKAQVATNEEGLTFPALGPDNEPFIAADGTETTWTVVGNQSNARKKAEDAESRRMLMAGRAQVQPADLRARRLNLAVACVTGFHGWEDDNGQAIPFNAHNVREILSADESQLRQVEEKIEQHSAFLSKRSTSSSTT